MPAATLPLRITPSPGVMRAPCLTNGANGPMAYRPPKLPPLR